MNKTNRHNMLTLLLGTVRLSISIMIPVPLVIGGCVPLTTATLAVSAMSAAAAVPTVPVLIIRGALLPLF